MRYKLFTTTTCYKCSIFKKDFLKQIERPYFTTMEGEIIDENHKDFHTDIQKYEIKSVPTLIIFQAPLLSDKPFENSESILLKTDEIYEVTKFLNS